MLSSGNVSSGMASFAEFGAVCGAWGAWGERCLYGSIIRRVSIELLLLPRIFVFDIESIGVLICVCELVVASWQHQCQPEEAHKFSDLIKLASLENCLNSLFLRGLTSSVLSYLLVLESVFSLHLQIIIVRAHY